MEIVTNPASCAFSLTEYAFACGEFGSYGHSSFTLCSRGFSDSTRVGCFSRTLASDELIFFCINTEAWIVSCVSGSFGQVGKDLSTLLASKKMPALELVDGELHQNLQWLTRHTREVAGCPRAQLVERARGNIPYPGIKCVQLEPFVKVDQLI